MIRYRQDFEQSLRELLLTRQINQIQDVRFKENFLVNFLLRKTDLINLTIRSYQGSTLTKDQHQRKDYQCSLQFNESKELLPTSNFRIFPCIEQ